MGIDTSLFLTNHLLDALSQTRDLLENIFYLRRHSEHPRSSSTNKRLTRRFSIARRKETSKLSSSLLPFFVYLRTHVIAALVVTQPSRRHISSLQISLLRPVQLRVPSYLHSKRYSNRHNTVFLARGSYLLFPVESQRLS